MKFYNNCIIYHLCKSVNYPEDIFYIFSAQNAIKAVRPSLDVNELKRYEGIKAKMNGEKSYKSDKRPKIGFN